MCCVSAVAGKSVGEGVGALRGPGCTPGEKQYKPNQRLASRPGSANEFVSIGAMWFNGRRLKSAVHCGYSSDNYNAAPLFCRVGPSHPCTRPVLYGRIVNVVVESTGDDVSHGEGGSAWCSLFCILRIYRRSSRELNRKPRASPPRANHHRPTQRHPEPRVTTGPEARPTTTPTNRVILRAKSLPSAPNEQPTNDTRIS